MLAKIDLLFCCVLIQLKIETRAWKKENGKETLTLLWLHACRAE
jgi:hypothetical protein